ncbi:FAD-binding oxidoreductase [Streptomyces sp. NBC_01275]|uniref:FAD-binding oxidoreductase n=1 Tax=Streptomyces sp. NBC_01275 TaxID=2903807 RepID=UPI002258183D|nr:FAD-binding oxidoreductase [Streptomyces sp. NBC_01275]MCX4765143.1 FAD-binding oxidoreductase [Streptomyces sp. NBC_01275]
MHQPPQGALVRRGDEAYEEARLDAVWNARKPHRHPAVVVRAENEQDVVAAVRLARAEGLTVGIRSGGHSWVGNGVRDGGMLLDLSLLQDISVDPLAGTASVQPAAKGPALLQALAPYGLFFPTGHAPTVGLGGFLLGGGYGWDSRHLGPACLSIEAVDVVLADGTLVHATDATHPALLWAARGSGPGFFGVVTRFHLALHDAPERILRTVHTYPLALRDEVLAWTYDTLELLPPEVEFSAKVGWGSGGLPPEQHGTPGLDRPTVSVTATAFAHGDADPLAALEDAPFRGHALRALVGAPTTMAELYDHADRMNPAGLRWALDGIWTDGPVDEILAAARPLLDSLPGAPSHVLWMLWGGFPERADACWSSQAKLYLSPNAGWTDPAEDLVHEQWAHGELAAIQHLSKGLQFSDNNLADRPDHGLRPEHATRLEEIRAVYDPDGLFHTYMTPRESTTAYAAAARTAAAAARTR